jgi:hypothetical protein
MDQDFASFLSWASSGNLLPPDFMFQEPTQGRGVHRPVHLDKVFKYRKVLNVRLVGA